MTQSLNRSSLSEREQKVLEQVALIGQWERLIGDGAQIDPLLFRDLLAKLLEIDHFYRELGGIAGYQRKIQELIQAQNQTVPREALYHSPSFIEIGEESDEVLNAIEWGIDELPQMAEIYPLGGAADRLHLVDPETKDELPAAKLMFGGKTLLEGLIHDLQAREFLYFLKHGVQLTTPIAIMTSHEKNNHAHVIQICEEAGWFGRPRESFRFFTQPLVPAVNQQGDWCIAGPLKPVLKPGGHGAIWKLARDAGIFSWLQSLGRRKGLIRQINNPIAGLDYGLLAFTGIGCRKEMLFGFASCPRLLKAAEGVIVLVETKENLFLSNIEYCDFAKFGIQDQPLKAGEPYSRFSSNTNILFADLQAISNAVDSCPFPGLLINLKNGSYVTESGEKKEEVMARLESTMQNISDVFVEKKGDGARKTFVTYNKREKTISTAKKAFVKGGSLQETPENCFYDLLKANRELLLQCGMTLPVESGLNDYLIEGPEVLFLYHPLLGPLYSMIRKKIEGGTMAIGSELSLQIRNFEARALSLSGSLQIIAENPIGCLNDQGELRYEKTGGGCILENVTIENEGVDWSGSSPFWKMDLKRKETVKIILKGSGRLIIRNRTLKGNHLIVVENGEERTL